MRASNSAGGKLMLIQGHKLKVGEVGIVGDTTATGRPHIALDVDQDRAHFAHPYLPATRSEMALPLKVGDRIIGALDVQSERRSAFDESDVEVLQVMADQLAVAIENARLLSEVQNSIREIEAAYGEYTQKSWRDWLRSSQRPSGYRYQGSAVRPSDQPTPESLLAWESGERAFTPVQSRGSSTNSGGRLVVPIKLRNQTFGVIEMSLASDQLPEDFSSLVDALSERLALALDGARLYQDTQRRAAQEQMTREISSHIRETLDVDSVLRIAAQEIGAQLGLHDLTIQLELPSQERE
jgi:GAF domain-containing protein